MTRYYEDADGEARPVDENCCLAVIGNGLQCSRRQSHPNGWCWQHDVASWRVNGDVTSRLIPTEDIVLGPLAEEVAEDTQPSDADKIRALIAENKALHEELAEIRAVLAEV